MRINSFLTCLFLFYCQVASVAQTVFTGDTTIREMTVMSISKKSSFFLISTRDDSCSLYTIISERKINIPQKCAEKIKSGRTYKFVLVSYSNCRHQASNYKFSSLPLSGSGYQKCSYCRLPGCPLFRCKNRCRSFDCRQ